MEPEGNIDSFKIKLKESLFDIRQEFYALKLKVEIVDVPNIKRRPLWISKDIKKFKNLVDQKLAILEKFDLDELRAVASNHTELELLDFSKELIGSHNSPGVLVSLSTFATNLLDYHIEKRSSNEALSNGLGCCEAQFEMNWFLLDNLVGPEK